MVNFEHCIRVVSVSAEVGRSSERRADHVRLMMFGFQNDYFSGTRSIFWGSGVEVCSLDAVLVFELSATVGPRVTVVAESCRAHGKSCKRRNFWRFHV